MDLAEITRQTEEVTRGLLEVARLKPGQILVLGCSTSEVRGQRIGAAGSTDVARAVLDGLRTVLTGTGVYLAVQCCEHLNRAIVISEEAAERYGLTPVTVLPVPGAGGATAALAMDVIDRAVVVEGVAAHAGIDIGDTLIGMHLRPVAVPVRLPRREIGQAHVTVARTRPRLIGGARAVYALDEVEQRFGKGVIYTKGVDKEHG